MVAIDGWGCGGKTALAEGLLDRLEPWMQCLSLDSFFCRLRPGPAVEPCSASAMGGVIRAARDQLSTMGRTTVCDYDWEAARILPPENLEGRAWLVEGLFGMRADLRPWYDLTIWVEGALERRLDRVAARDGVHMIPFWEKDWMPRERLHRGRAGPGAAPTLLSPARTSA